MIERQKNYEAVMNDTINEKSISFAEKALTCSALSDLKNHLGAIKNRTKLMANSIDQKNPLQKHFIEIIYCINEGLEATDFLSDSFEVSNLFKEGQ